MLEIQIRVSFFPLGTHHLAQEINSELYFVIDAFNIGNTHKKRVKILPEKIWKSFIEMISGLIIK